MLLGSKTTTRHQRYIAYQWSANGKAVSSTVRENRTLQALLCC